MAGGGARASCSSEDAGESETGLLPVRPETKAEEVEARLRAALAAAQASRSNNPLGVLTTSLRAKGPKSGKSLCV